MRQELRVGEYSSMRQHGVLIQIVALKLSNRHFAQKDNPITASVEDYGLIGDCQTAALVSMDGSIDWLCWPRFDSGACFAALLGDTNNGRWRIAAADNDVRITRRYRPNTLILETSFVTATGEVMLIDFMPLRTRGSHLVRLVVGKRGTVRMSTELIIRFGYGSFVPWVRRTDDGGLLAISGPDMLVLRTPVELRGESEPLM